MPETTEIDLKLIRIDGGTQPRAQLNWIIVSEYAESIENGNVFPPIEVIYDGKDYWLWDGFHRVEAYRKAGCLSIRTNVRQGTRRDAVLLSVGANNSHGLRRTNDDKRRAVMTLLNDAEWVLWSDREIARQCGVSNQFVSNMRPIPSVNGRQIERVVQRNGTTYTQNTTSIGKATTPPAIPVKQATLPTYAPVTQRPAIVPVMPVLQKPVAEVVINDAPIPIVMPSLADEIDPITAAEVNEEREEFTEAIPQVTLPIIDIINIDSQYIGSIGIEPVHLVVTSPPYNVGVDYDAYVDDISTYIELITAIWKECYKVMVDGARIAVVVPFGIGRNPYVPFDSQIMQTIVDAGFELRGRIVWDKNTTGNRTSWGSFRLPSDPGLRDTTECIIVAHKVQSKLDVPEDTKLRDEKGTHTAWLADSDEFMALAQDHWVIAPESAKRVGHPAPFPVKLAESLIKFYAYPGAHILDPYELIPLEFSRLYPSEWRPEKNARDKDLIYIPEDYYSIEIKTSSNPNSIFGNRSYAQEGMTNKKSKSGYYLAVNFEKFSEINHHPKILKIRFGWLDNKDWTGQASETGQQAKLTRFVEENKLIQLYPIKQSAL